MKLDDSRIFETFRIIEKSYDNPEDLTPSEKARLRELGLDIN